MKICIKTLMALAMGLMIAGSSVGVAVDDSASSAASSCISELDPCGLNPHSPVPAQPCCGTMKCDDSMGKGANCAHISNSGRTNLEEGRALQGSVANKRGL